METELDEVEPIEAVAPCCNDGLLVVDGDEEVEDDMQAVSVGVTETVELNVAEFVTVLLVDRVYVFDADGHDVTEID